MKFLLSDKIIKLTIGGNPCWGDAPQPAVAWVATGGVQLVGPVFFAGGLGDPHWWPPGLLIDTTQSLKL